MRDHGRSLGVAAGAANHTQALPPIAALLCEWQTTGARLPLEQLVAATWVRLERRIAMVLRQHGVHDPNTVDDAMSLVLDHLRRLPGTAAGDRPVTPFEPGRADGGNGGHHDAGIGYLLRLAHSRALDLARARRTRDGVVFSDLPLELPGRVPSRKAAPHPVDQLLLAAAGLEPRQRTVIEMLLDGKSQATIAHVLQVSEGTVSRLRGRAIEGLRDRLATNR